MIRPARLEIALALALLVTSAVTFSIIHRSGSSRAHEPPVREKIHTAISLERAELEQKINANPSLVWRFRVASVGGFLLMFGVLFSVLRLLACVFTRRPLYQPLGSPPEPAWQGRQLFRLVLWLVLLSQWILLAEWALVRWFHPAWLDRHVVAIGNTFLIDGVVLILGGKWLIRSRIRSAQPRPSFPAAVKFAAVSYLTVLPLLVGVVIVVTKVVSAMGFEPEPQPVFSIFLFEPRRVVMICLLLLAALAGPVAEEIFFRGLLYGWLRRRIGIGRALLLTGFLFPCLHTDAVSFAPIFALGLLFGWVYEKTGSLAAPAAIHVLHNAGMLYAAFLIRTLAALS